MLHRHPHRDDERNCDSIFECDFHGVRTGSGSDRIKANLAGHLTLFLQGTDSMLVEES